VAPVCKPYLDLREALSDYMQGDSVAERIYPSDRQVVDIMDAAQGASEVEVIACLRYLREERGLHPGSRHGPRQFSWFPTVVGDYFRQKREREDLANPKGVPVERLNGAVFDAMTEAIAISSV